MISNATIKYDETILCIITCAHAVRVFWIQSGWCSRSLGAGSGFLLLATHPLLLRLVAPTASLMLLISPVVSAFNTACCCVCRRRQDVCGGGPAPAGGQGEHWGCAELPQWAAAASAGPQPGPQTGICTPSFTQTHGLHTCARKDTHTQTHTWAATIQQLSTKIFNNEFCF